MKELVNRVDCLCNHDEDKDDDKSMQKTNSALVGPLSGLQGLQGLLKKKPSDRNVIKSKDESVHQIKELDISEAVVKTTQEDQVNLTNQALIQPYLDSDQKIGRTDSPESQLELKEITISKKENSAEDQNIFENFRQSDQRNELDL